MRALVARSSRCQPMQQADVATADDDAAGERVALMQLGPQEVEGEPGSGEDLESVSSSPAATEDEEAAEDEEAGSRGCGCCCAGRSTMIPDVIASNGDHMFAHEKYIPWFAEDGWRVAACRLSGPASLFMALGGCSLIATQYLRANCPPESFRHPDNSNRTAAACFAAGVAIFWACSIMVARELPTILGLVPSAEEPDGGASTPADETEPIHLSGAPSPRQRPAPSASPRPAPSASPRPRNEGPLHLIGLRDSGRPQLLSEAAVQELGLVGKVSHLICVTMALWFIGLGVFSVAPLVTGHTTDVFDHGTDFFPPDGCPHGSGPTIRTLRVLIAATSAPAGVLISLLFNILFLSQFLAVAFAKQAVDNLNRKLHHSHDLPLERSSSAEASDEDWQKEVHKPFVALARKTMPQLSAWGASLAAQTVGCLLLGILTIPLAVATGGNPVAVTLISVAAFPFMNLWGPATVSTRCDMMRDRLNEIRVDEDEKQ